MHKLSLEYDDYHDFFLEPQLSTAFKPRSLSCTDFKYFKAMYMTHTVCPN